MRQPTAPDSLTNRLGGKALMGPSARLVPSRLPSLSVWYQGRVMTSPDRQHTRHVRTRQGFYCQVARPGHAALPVAHTDRHLVVGTPKAAMCSDARNSRIVLRMTALPSKPLENGVTPAPFSCSSRDAGDFWLTFPVVVLATGRTGFSNALPMSVSSSPSQPQTKP
eukprot:scaffold795_cov375-Prasinococcus_capsulatus_cf.AAC.32